MTAPAAEPSREALRTEAQPAQQGMAHRAAIALAEPSEASIDRPAASGSTPDPGFGHEAGGTAIEQQRAPSCTPAQMRRFIKSRPWIPMHELRRRFGINGAEDDVTPIRVGEQRLFVGLPPPEGGVLAELLSGGDVGFELSLDPGAPILIGVFPMRPVPRS
jgi:hypothetical protein